MNVQPGILSDPAPYHIHLEYIFEDVLDLVELKHIIRSEHESSEIRNRRILFGFSDRLWNQISDDGIPGQFAPFAEINSRYANAPSTQGDLWVWLHGNSHAWNLDSAASLDQALIQLGATRNLEIKGFVRHENRDYTGFIDGTENPQDQDAVDAVLIPSGDGGSFALTQNWVHNLEAFHALEIVEQEKVIGRTKPDSVELSEDEMPVNSHVSRTDAEVDGVKQKIVRRSVPFGNLEKRGLHFVAFACEIGRIQIQLERMFGTAGDGIHDRLIEFSNPVSGSYWYVPGNEKLHSLS